MGRKPAQTGARVRSRLWKPRPSGAIGPRHATAAGPAAAASCWLCRRPQPRRSAHGRGRGRGGTAAGGCAGGAEGGCRAEGSGPRRRGGRPSTGSGAPRWDWFLRSHFLSNQTADWRREPTRAALEVCVSLRPMIAPKPTPL